MSDQGESPPAESTVVADEHDVSPDAPVVDDEPAIERATPLTRSDLGGSPNDRTKLGPIALGAVALLLVGFILGRVTADADGTDEDAPTTTLAAVQFPSGDQDRAGYWGFGGVTPAVADSFDGGDTTDGLGDADTGQPWSTVSGAWRVQDATASASEGGRQPSIVVVEGGAADRLTEATSTVVEEGAGIVFRFRDRNNYWSMTAVPSLGIWTVTRVVDGEPTIAAEIPGATADGTTVTVAQRGTELQILIEGIEALRVTDGALAGQRQSGLIAPADGDGTARFDRFYVGDMPT